MATYWKIENHVSLFEKKKKKKKKRKSVIKTFRACYFGQHFFHWEVLTHETEAILIWVRNKMTLLLE